MAADNSLAVNPIGKIWKTDHGLTRHAQHFVQDALGFQHGLQGLRNDGVIE